MTHRNPLVVVNAPDTSDEAPLFALMAQILRDADEADARRGSLRPITSDKEARP